MSRDNASAYLTHKSANNHKTEIMHYDELIASMDPLSLTVPHIKIIK
jgi:hypothetical protein